MLRKTVHIGNYSFMRKLRSCSATPIESRGYGRPCGLASSCTPSAAHNLHVTQSPRRKHVSGADHRATALRHPRRLLGVYCAHEEGRCCNNRTTPMPETSIGPVKPFRPWLSTASLPQRPTAASAGGGSAPSMPTMRLGTSALSSRATKVARLRPQIQGPGITFAAWSK